MLEPGMKAWKVEYDHETTYCWIGPEVEVVEPHGNGAFVRYQDGSVSLTYMAHPSKADAARYVMEDAQGIVNNGLRLIEQMKAIIAEGK